MNDIKTEPRLTSTLVADDLAKFKPLRVNVHIYNTKASNNAEPERSRPIDLNKFDDREWFLRTLVWATCNGREICVLNQRDDV